MATEAEEQYFIYKQLQREFSDEENVLYSFPKRRTNFDPLLLKISFENDKTYIVSIEGADNSSIVKVCINVDRVVSIFQRKKQSFNQVGGSIKDSAGNLDRIEQSIATALGNTAYNFIMEMEDMAKGTTV